MSSYEELGISAGIQTPWCEPWWESPRYRVLRSRGLRASACGFVLLLFLLAWWPPKSLVVAPAAEPILGTYALDQDNEREPMATHTYSRLLMPPLPFSARASTPD